MPQQALRRQDHERQRIVLQQRRLAPQQVEVLRRGRAVRDPDVDVGRELQKTLGPCTGVIRPLPFVAVWEEQHHRGLRAPLAPGRHEELVDHHLGAVDEVAVLGFPDHQAGWFLDVVAVLEPNTAFSEWAVVDLECHTAWGSPQGT